MYIPLKPQFDVLKKYKTQELTRQTPTQQIQNQQNPSNRYDLKPKLQMHFEPQSPKLKLTQQKPNISPKKLEEGKKITESPQKSPKKPDHKGFYFQQAKNQQNSQRNDNFINNNSDINLQTNSNQSQLININLSKSINDIDSGGMGQSGKQLISLKPNKNHCLQTYSSVKTNLNSNIKNDNININLNNNNNQNKNLNSQINNNGNSHFQSGVQKIDLSQKQSTLKNKDLQKAVLNNCNVAQNAQSAQHNSPYLQPRLRKNNTIRSLKALDKNGQISPQKKSQPYQSLHQQQQQELQQDLQQQQLQQQQQQQQQQYQYQKNTIQQNFIKSPQDEMSLSQKINKIDDLKPTPQQQKSITPRHSLQPSHFSSYNNRQQKQEQQNFYDLDIKSTQNQVQTDRVYTHQSPSHSEFSEDLIKNSQYKNYSKKETEIMQTIKRQQIPQYSKSRLCEKSVGKIYSYSANTNQGLIRNYNEDRMAIILNIQKPYNKEYHSEYWPDISFMAIYDGHGGVACADFLRDNLHQYLIKDPEFPSNPIQALKNAHEHCEKDFCTQALTKKPVDKSGSCSISVLIIDDMCYVANVGDSRAIISEYGGKLIYPLSKDHKPQETEEFNRIKDAGGRIYQSKINKNKGNLNNDQEQQFILGPHRVYPGRLSVARTFGDVEAKYRHLGGNPNCVIAKPDIRCFKITDNHDFIVLASDGIYDRLENEDLSKAVYLTEELNNSKNGHEYLGNAVDNIMKLALAKKTMDNISVLILDFGMTKKLFQNKNNQISKKQLQPTATNKPILSKTKTLNFKSETQQNLSSPLKKYTNTHQTPTKTKLQFQAEQNDNNNNEFSLKYGESPLIKKSSQNLRNQTQNKNLLNQYQSLQPDQKYKQKIELEFQSYWSTVHKQQNAQLQQKLDKQIQNTSEIENIQNQYQIYSSQAKQQQQQQEQKTSQQQDPIRSRVSNSAYNRYSFDQQSFDKMQQYSSSNTDTSNSHVYRHSIPNLSNSVIEKQQNRKKHLSITDFSIGIGNVYNQNHLVFKSYEKNRLNTSNSKNNRINSQNSQNSQNNKSINQTSQIFQHNNLNSNRNNSNSFIQNSQIKNY